MTHPAVIVDEDGDCYQARCETCGSWACARMISVALDDLGAVPCTAG